MRRPAGHPSIGPPGNGIQSQQHGGYAAATGSGLGAAGDESAQQKDGIDVLVLQQSTNDGARAQEALSEPQQARRCAAEALGWKGCPGQGCVLQDKCIDGSI